jgi:hypothetical protein
MAPLSGSKTRGDERDVYPSILHKPTTFSSARVRSTFSNLAHKAIVAPPGNSAERRPMNRNPLNYESGPDDEYPLQKGAGTVTIISDVSALEQDSIAGALAHSLD